ncbi:MAG: response regulator [Thermodesulfobacteriota bacterium]
MSKSVLIIDDSKTMRKIITRTLRQAGVNFETIEEADDGQMALDHLAQSKPDLILCDINMPNMDGLTFLQHKAQDASIKDIPVVMITTEGGSEDVVQDAKDKGAAASIKKPFNAEQIEDVIAPLV